MGKQMSGNTFNERKSPAEMQSAAWHTSEQDSWAAPAASWQVSLGKTEQPWVLSAPSKQVLSSAETKFPILTPVRAAGRKPPVFPDASCCTHPCTPFSSLWCLSSAAMLCQDVILEKQTWIFLLIRASRPGSCVPVPPPPAGTLRVSGSGDHELPHQALGPSYLRTAGWEWGRALHTLLYSQPELPCHL